MNNVFKEKGFTLIEVLIGLIILSFGILAIARMQITSVRGNFFSSNLMQATYVAQDRLEFLKNPPVHLLSPTNGDRADGTATILGVVFHRSYAIVANGNLRTIHYTVLWNDGIDHRVTFSTIRSQ